jgi:hypothetical protein
LNEVVRHHNARRACYRGLPKVLIQAVLTALVVNAKRIVKLMAQPVNAVAEASAVRAEVGVT